MEDIIYIDDTVTENSDYGKIITDIVTNKTAEKYSIRFINNKSKLDSFLKSVLKSVTVDIKLVLLDLDLSKIKGANAENILQKLTEKKKKVIVLSGLPKTKQTRKEEGLDEYQQSLPTMNTLYNKGALAYIYKSELDDNATFVANIIYRTINDPSNSRYALYVNEKLCTIEIKDSSDVIVRKEFTADIDQNWKSANKPQSNWDIIFKLLYEMANMNKTECKLGNIFDWNSLKGTQGFLYINYFHKTLGSFNDEIRSNSNGLIVGRLLQGGGHGNRSGVYRVNIGQTALAYIEQEAILPDWKTSVEERLSFLESELKKLQKSIASKL